MDKLIEEWIVGRYVKESSARTNRTRITKFFEWSKLTHQQLLELSTKEIKSLLVQWTKEQVENGIPINSVLAYITSVRAFLDFNEKPLGELPNLPSMHKTIKDHVFSTDDLKKMWNISDTRDKALIATFASLGLGMSDVLNLDTEYIKQLIDRATSENQDSSVSI